MVFLVTACKERVARSRPVVLPQSIRSTLKVKRECWLISFQFCFVEWKSQILLPYFIVCAGRPELVFFVGLERFESENTGHVMLCKIVAGCEI